MVMPVVQKIAAELAGIRVKVDDRTEVNPGFKFNDWEMRGVPLRIEIGPMDVEKGSVALARRDKPGREGKSFVPQAGIAATVSALLAEIQQALYDRALAFREAHIAEPADYDALKDAVQTGWAYSYWCGSRDCEAKVKEDTKATTRCIPMNQLLPPGKCIVCGQPASDKAYFAKAY